MTLNRFAMLPLEAKQRLVSFLALVQHQAAQSAQLQEAMPDAAGMLDAPPLYPPKTTVRLMGQVDPNAAGTLASGSLPQTPAPGVQPPVGPMPGEDGGSSPQPAQPAQPGPNA